MSGKWVTPSVNGVLRAKAITNGGRIQETRDGKLLFTSIEWRVAGNCEAPVYRLVKARKVKRSPVHVFQAGGAPISTYTDVWVRCRSCKNCRAWRAREWRNRMVAEIKGAARTWFVTLTYTAENHVRKLSEVRARLDRNGVDFEALTSEQIYTELANHGYRDVQLWLKRLRKGEVGPAGTAKDKSSWLRPPLDFKFVVVAEAHKSGLPHWHALIHQRGSETIKARALKNPWENGFSTCRLVRDERAAGYVTKYVQKADTDARIRASVRYGTTDLPPQR